MATELPDRLTAIDKKELIAAFWHAWGQYFGRYPPRRESIWVLIAQVWLETGLIKCHNYNLGNVKSRIGDGFDYQFFECGEELPVSTATTAAKQSPLVVIVKQYKIGTKEMASVRIKPKHPWCRFRAFRCLLDGVVDHLHLVANRYQKAWPHVIAGDPEAYSKALKAQGYYTASETLYTKGLLRCFKGMAEVPFDYANLPSLTDQEIGRIQNLIAVTQQMLVNDIDFRSRAAFDED